MNLALIRLLHLASPTLPVGAYTYSQGLEWAVESGAITNEASAGKWIGDCLTHSLGSFEAVYLAHMLAAWRDSDTLQQEDLDAEFIASRETAELRAETLQMGHSLARLLEDLGIQTVARMQRSGIRESARSPDSGQRPASGLQRRDAGAAPRLAAGRAGAPASGRADAQRRLPVAPDSAFSCCCRGSGKLCRGRSLLPVSSMLERGNAGWPVSRSASLVTAPRRTVVFCLVKRHRGCRSR